MSRCRWLTTWVIFGLIIWQCGCSPRRSLLEPEPRVVTELQRYGAAEALARAELRATSENSARAYTHLAQTRAAVAAELNGTDKQTMGRQAAQALDKALHLEASYAPAAVQKAEVLLNGGEAKAAEKLLSELLKAGQEVAEAYALLSRALVLQKRPAEAAQAATDGLQQHPREPLLHWALAVAQSQQGQVDQAEASFTRALKLSPRDGQLRLAYAEFLRSESRHSEAAVQSLEAVNLAVKKRHRDAEIKARFFAGTNLYMAGEKAAAIAQFKEALILDPQQPECANNLALVLADENLDTAAAVAWARVAVRASRNDPKTAETLGWALARDGQYTDALRILRTLQRRWPDRPAIAYHLGWTLMKTGKRTEGRELLQQAATSADTSIAQQAKQALAELEP